MTLIAGLVSPAGLDVGRMRCNLLAGYAQVGTVVSDAIAAFGQETG